MSSILDRQLMSLYVTLLLSVGCLGYAELGQELPETPYLYSFMFIALGMAYWAEGKLSLSIAASNALAVGLLSAGVVWIYFKMRSHPQNYEAGNNMVRVIVSYTGPILCALLLAKLFRPKSASDQWLLQLLGLVQVILASVLAMSSRMDRDAPLFPVLMLLYLASVAWSFRLFYLRGEVEQTTTQMARSSSPTVGWFSMVPVAWFLLCFLIAVVIFFCLPQGGLDASLFQGIDQSETGSTSKIDLNADGEVQVSEERVMRIWAKDRKGPIRLPETMRLRGAILSNYNERKGEWNPFPTAVMMPQELPEVPGPIPENAARIEFDIDVAQIQELGQPRQARNSTSVNIPLFLADPPVTNRYSSRYFSTPARGRNLTPLNANTFEGQCWLSMTHKTATVSLTHDYTGKLNATEWEQNLRFMPPDYNEYMKSLVRVPTRLKASGRIAKFCQDIFENEKLTTGSFREKARALESHLSSGAFKYSLLRRKQDTALDPTEDFLFNVKEGHCERYASALTMMLRSVGIPSRIIIGYRGLEWNELGGFHVVRQFHAHAWVEALVDQTIQADGTKRLHWVTLDPTPMTEARSVESTFTSPLTFARFLWEFFILDFSGQAQRNKLIAQLQHTPLGRLFSWWFTLDAWQAVSLLIAFCGFLIVSIWLLLRWLKNRRIRRLEQRNISYVTVPFYARFLKLLSRRGWKPDVGQTPTEFADTVQQRLFAEEKNTIADIPAAIVPPYYAVRFGGVALDQQQTSTLDQQLQKLQAELRR